MSASNIVLGDGVFAIGGTAVALTRGGGRFTVEREFRQIEADGDFGPVKERIRKTKSMAKLVMNALEILPANLAKFYPATAVDSITEPTKAVWTGTSDILTADYAAAVTWTGKTKAGKAVVITVQNAINLENIDWSIVDKEEIVPELTFTATYDEATRTTEPWKVEFTV